MYLGLLGCQTYHQPDRPAILVEHLGNKTRLYIIEDLVFSINGYYKNTFYNEAAFIITINLVRFNEIYLYEIER